MFALVLTAELNGVTNLRPQDTAETPFWYTFTVQLMFQETNELSGSRGEANFVWKCKNCKRESSASIKAAPKPYERTEPPKGQTIIEFDCRGLEFTNFSPEGEWLADGIDSATKFQGIDCLQEGEWFDYDEKTSEEVSIKDLKWEIKQKTRQYTESRAESTHYNLPIMSFVPINPRPMLQDLVNKDIVVRLKWGETEYKGRLVSIDSYMNIQLTNAQEFIDQKFTSDLGQILIRCNNVLWIKGANQGDNGDVAMRD
ncbi:hypothetical protein DL768_009417 [Monosporascus sp. mg162]|nr:hypothetical protein DL768_009417 [Monosporascus sp. mg162]